MQVQKHARIVNIRKLSRYFLFLSVFAMAMVAIGGLAFPVIMVMAPSGDLTLTAYLAKAVTLNDGFFTLLQSGISTDLKVIASVVAILFCALMEFVLVHINKLLTCFYEGEIFNRKAIFHARRAFNLNLILAVAMLGINLLAIIFSYVEPSAGGSGNIGHFLGSVLDQLTWIGFFLLLLWSLEIGVDLNEEAELTI
ncbi:hypothetical protein H8L32_13910 [Undibacterium sp. CY18W]|uniref:DUF2975 domain-containing protein n=1 Tax=Undibacterium hunanense TaxID=2762292 RepID=A0ABR6ZSJ3_9BURK|nr:hypothetical protein [Undibacterium hunanense]MBC3918584.1 hypothetical protein [Undibacterium hunanense]